MRKEAQEEAVRMRKEGEEKAEAHVNATEHEAEKKEAAAHAAVLAELAKEKKVKEEAEKMRNEAQGEATKIKNEAEENAGERINTTEIDATKNETAAHNAVLAMLATEKMQRSRQKKRRYKKEKM